jgi:hypothetical protein
MNKWTIFLHVPMDKCMYRRSVFFKGAIMRYIIIFFTEPIFISVFMRPPVVFHI